MKQKKDNKKVILIVLILLAMLILIIIALNCLGEIDNKQLIPTGNVDIFEVIFKVGNKQENTIDDNNMIVGEIKETDVEMTVYDDETIWSNWTKLNIFKNTSYLVEGNKIAPDSENSYQFVIRNNNDFNVKYNLILSENNKLNINMRYRLKKNGEYIVGNGNEYVTYDKLNQYNVNLVNNAYDVYTLDWKWVESENDTQIGEEDIDVNYKLNLQILAMQVSKLEVIE